MFLILLIFLLYFVAILLCYCNRITYTKPSIHHQTTFKSPSRPSNHDPISQEVKQIGNIRQRYPDAPTSFRTWKGLDEISFLVRRNVLSGRRRKNDKKKHVKQVILSSHLLLMIKASLSLELRKLGKSGIRKDGEVFMALLLFLLKMFKRVVECCWWIDREILS